MALLELPRGCDYWHDERMNLMINSTDSHIHDFDGCMYGLTTQFGDQRVPIKKPWRIVSWGVKFSLNKKCDRNHDHGKCEGRETRVTQTYTCQIVDIILKTVRRQMTIRFKESLLMLDNACSSCKHDRRSAKKIAVSTINNTSEVALDLSDEVCQMVMYQSCQPRKLRLSINTRSIVHDIIDFIIFDHRRKSDRKPVCGTATGST